MDLSSATHLVHQLLLYVWLLPLLGLVVIKGVSTKCSNRNTSTFTLVHLYFGTIELMGTCEPLFRQLQLMAYHTNTVTRNLCVCTSSEILTEITEEELGYLHSSLPSIGLEIGEEDKLHATRMVGLLHGDIWEEVWHPPFILALQNWLSILPVCN